MLTTAAGPDEAVRVFEAGADDYVAKPFHPEELASRIRSLLRIRALQDELKERREELELANQMLNADLEGVADLLLNIVSLRVPDAHIRGERARSLARWIGERLEMTGADVRAMDLAARLHEIGKIVMPDEIILKPLAQLSASDRETLAQFPLFGQMLIGSVRPLRYVDRVLRHQLENYDGTGQPDRLMKGEIPLASRILRVVNFLEDHEDGAKREPAGIIEALRNAKGVILDPMLEQLSEEFILVTEHSSWLEGKRAVKLEALSEGMVIAADIFTGSGVKLLHEGSALTRSQIDRVVAYHRTDPVVNRIYIYQDDVPREQEGGA
jgi:response regulator RpfG family c-di-GMP phosphodiesterase